MRRTLLFAFGVFAVGIAAAALAQAWPAKPVRIVVPFSTGTAADIAARQLATRLAEAWGQGVVVENVMGAGGNIGAVTVAKAAPDGYTLLMAGINNVINPSLYAEAGYDMARDFKPIARIAVAPLALVANPAFPPSSVTELVALARAKPKTVLYGSGGNGSVTHLVFELLKTKTTIEMTHVPYKGIAQMMTDILGNQIPLGAPAAASALPQLKSGKLKVLAVTSAKRSTQLPDVPTVAESGIPDFDVSAWNGLVAPARTPDEVVAKVYADVATIAQAKEFVEAMQKAGLETDPMTPAEFRAFISAELAKWSKLVKDSGAKLD
ncbi:MAG TPA: tripartite tricarboxylate transporter substrate binding protein [Burkholderiales bacterium]|nr:tripartite tricarboxylate transporter substrate binding protein [Burkholderiales bacterium]